MLYIFHVDTGATLTFDIKLALQSVAELKEAIERECGVLAAHQVLLMSGGESLEAHARVCSYSAGTDTNPIYLFSKAAIESQEPPTPHTDYSTDVDLADQISASLAMPATYSTLVSRANLAQQCWAIAREQTRTCERLVHDQHLQQQGWAAVVANLEDITQMFQSKADLLQQSFTQYLTEREQHMQLLANFNSDLQNLSKIPILPALRAQAEGILSPDDQTPESECGDKVLSLLRWISAKDNQSSLEQVAEQCQRGLEQFDERMMEALKNEVNAAIDASNKSEMKEIKGLGERLFALEQLMAQTKRLVQEQGELAQGFHQNQTRANNLGDASVLPDLCASHRRQLAVMMQNHNQLRDIRRRCTRAKEELSVNIYHRLKWIMYVENKMMEVDGKLVMYHENLKRLRRHLEVLQQIHLAPQMYIRAVTEVVRRRTFSQAFLVWASNLACQLLIVHNEEITRRKEFQNKFDGHFLNTLFPGLEDVPPPFATQAPTVFDNGLPKLTADDMESLKVQLPDLADSITTPDLNSITQFFISKSITETASCTTDNTKNKESSSSSLIPVDVSTKEVIEQVTVTSNRIGFESETDTDGFEKIPERVIDSKHQRHLSYEQKQTTNKQLEVGCPRCVSSSFSASTNMSSITSRVDLNRFSSSSEQITSSYHFPSLLTTTSTATTTTPPTTTATTTIITTSNLTENKPICVLSAPIFLSPLAECAEQNINDSNNAIITTSDITTIPSNITSTTTNTSIMLITNNYRANIHSNNGNNNNDNGDDVNLTSIVHDDNAILSTSPHQSTSISSSLPKSSAITCDGLHQRQSSVNCKHPDSGGSSPFGESGNADFVGTEFYIDESLPSSLSEHPTDAHTAIVSLLQENLGNTRSEVERLRSIIRTLKVTMTDAITVFRQELSQLKDKVNDDKGSIISISERVCEALVLHTQECERVLREREQELTVDHELELADAKKLIQARDDEIFTLKQTIIEKDTEFAEQERLMSTKLIRQKLENDQAELRSLQTQFQSELDNALEQARLDKEKAVKQAEETREAEINSLKNIVEQYKVNIEELEENLAASRAEQQKLIKEATDKLQLEFKTELETIRSRFKLMAASSVMERSPSDSSLEKIERPDVIELASHEAILAQTKENMEAEKAEAIRKAIEKETSEFEAKLQYGLSLATKQLSAELEAQRLREFSLVEECRQYKDMIRRVTDEECRARQQLTEKLEIVEEEKRRLESKMTAERKAIKQRDCQIHDLETERTKLRQELSEERMKMSQSSGASAGALVDTLKMLLSSGKDDIVEVSESKKVRLEAAGDAEGLLQRLEMLEVDNNRLNAELRAVRDNKESVEARVEALEADKVRLEVELVKERSRKGFAASDSGIASSIESRDKEMNASVALVSDSSQEAAGVVDQSTSSSRHEQIKYRDKLIKSTNNLLQQLSVSLNTCNPGDSVIVLWDTVHSSYIILQESRTMYFLHSDCIDALDLRLSSDGLPRQIYVFGEVVDKQYCHAKKPENRYHVPQGTKFYRVRVKPVHRDLDLIASTSEKCQQ